MRAGSLLAGAALGCLLALPALAQSPAQPLELQSPDGRNVVRVATDAQSRPTYTVLRDGQVILAPSAIVLELTDDRIGPGMAIAGADRRDGAETYPIVAGKAAEGGAPYRELTVHFRESGAEPRSMDVVLRAYDDGVAFRTVLPVQPRTAATLVRDELTEFRFAQAYECWGFNTGSFGRSHEGEFDPIDTTRTHEHNLFDVPFLCRTDRAAFALAEADLTDFAGMYLTGRGDGGLGLRAKLSPSLDDPRVAVRTRVGSPVATPWRVVMLGDHAGELLDSTLLTDLAEPSRLADTGWIKPGLSAWDWWNGPSLAAVPQAGINTATAKAFIDFAAANGLPYMMVDEGWYAGAGGAGVVRPGADVTRTAPGFDLAEVVRYGRDRGVGIWLWTNWRALDAQMEEALTVYEQAGVAGIKVDFMDRDDQWMVNWYTKLLSAAARHRLMVNLHGAFAPRGLTRTFPNFMTQEGVLGAEYNKWTGRITAEHNVMLAYTRGMLGPMDYTPGGFRNTAPADFTVQSTLPNVQTTRAHGLAMYAVYLSPVGMVSDSPDTYAASPAGLDFIRQVPASWDETRFLAGEVGEWIAVARRKGTDWYVGVMNGLEGRTVELPLAKLGPAFTVEHWLDGSAPDAVETGSRQVHTRRPLRVKLAPSGGAAMILRPAAD
ncbi:glycoside hydrolase family 97 protein (plasmid) [Croceibacterium sp. TMG7-5b_MA50]|uniref:glycoside hydrolase family 97 protein n=1 Tax=Croceibacterium sp. TMG7-5b_MA50 TaxID=3121290 RepID=UPI003221DCF5